MEKVVTILYVSLGRIAPHFKGLSLMPQKRLQKAVRNGSPFKLSILLTFLLGIILRVVAVIIQNNA